jgi:large subunit ribosomal protein L19e
MNLRKQKQLASRALGVSKKRIKFNLKDADSTKAVKELISREAVKELLEDKTIEKIPKKGNSRTNANFIAAQKKKGRRSGQGSRKGTATARIADKEKWMEKIRALRAELKKLKDQGRLEVKTYRDLYRKSKGNFFRNKKHLAHYIQQNNLLKEVKAKDKKSK